MKNQHETMKNHENPPGAMKNQPGTMKNHENQHENVTSRTGGSISPPLIQKMLCYQQGGSTDLLHV